MMLKQMAERDAKEERDIGRKRDVENRNKNDAMTALMR